MNADTASGLAYPSTNFEQLGAQVSICAERQRNGKCWRKEVQ